MTRWKLTGSVTGAENGRWCANAQGEFFVRISLVIVNCWFRPRQICDLCCCLKIKCAMMENKEMKKPEKKKEKKNEKGKKRKVEMDEEAETEMMKKQNRW